MHATYPYHCILLDLTTLRMQIMNLITVQLSPSSWYFFCLRCKYSSQRPVLKRPQPIFFLTSRKRLALFFLRVDILKGNHVRNAIQTRQRTSMHSVSSEFIASSFSFSWHLMLHSYVWSPRHVVMKVPASAYAC
jgi:hypothetical protein